MASSTATKESKLFRLRMIHTLIWWGYVILFAYILVDLILDWLSPLLWISLGLIVIEGIILLTFQWRCPLTIKAGEYAEDRSPGFDIFLPRWMAKHNKTFFSLLFAIELGLLGYRLLT